MVNTPSGATLDLLFFGLDHGINSVRDGGGPLIPLTVTEASGERSLQRFVAERVEESVAHAAASAKATPLTSQVVLVYDGFLTHGGLRTDAIFAEVREGPEVAIMVQRYRPKKLLRRFETVGEPTLIAGPGQL
ncbi:MAG: hypothetical protein ACRDGD_08720 [Candidatus Limnocylindria bacterium]